MDNKYIGKSVTFPFSINEKGRLYVVGGEESILSSCYSILSTPVGERLFLPEFGSRLSLLFYQPYHNGTKSLISTVVEEALETWENRCKFLSVEFDETRKDDGVIGLIISIRIKSTSEIKAFIFPFYTKLIH